MAVVDLAVLAVVQGFPAELSIAWQFAACIVSDVLTTGRVQLLTIWNMANAVEEVHF